MGRTLTTSFIERQFATMLSIVVATMVVASESYGQAPKLKRPVKTRNAPIDPYAPEPASPPVAVEPKNRPSNSKPIDPYRGQGSSDKSATTMSQPMSNPYTSPAATLNPFEGSPKQSPFVPSSRPTVPTTGKRTINPFAQSGDVATGNADMAANKRDMAFKVADLPNERTAAQPLRITDTERIAGLLAVARLDGWMLADTGNNAVAQSLVLSPTAAKPTFPWLYWLPQQGGATVVCHRQDCGAFAGEANRISYERQQELEPILTKLLKGKRAIAVEKPSSKSNLSVGGISAGMAEMLRSNGVTLVSSDLLVQYTSAIWSQPGKVQHVLATAQVAEIRKDAIAFVKSAFARGTRLTELDVQQRIATSMRARGLLGPTPRVAAGIHTALPRFVATAANTAVINRGDVLLITIAAKTANPGAIFAEATWAAVVDTDATPLQKKTFAAVLRARDAALAALAAVPGSSGAKSLRRGFQIDELARASLTKDGLLEASSHGVGFSMDTEHEGRGANLDNTVAKDERTIILGTGFVVGPGVYIDHFIDDIAPFGIRSTATIYLGASAAEVTSAVQAELDPILK
jgi:Xaa-Pro aminopeptidase